MQQPDVLALVLESRAACNDLEGWEDGSEEELHDRLVFRYLAGLFENGVKDKSLVDKAWALLHSPLDPYYVLVLKQNAVSSGSVATLQVAEAFFDDVVGLAWVTNNGFYSYSFDIHFLRVLEQCGIPTNAHQGGIPALPINALAFAIERGDQALVRYLLQRGAGLPSADSIGLSSAEDVCACVNLVFELRPAEKDAWSKTIERLAARYNQPALLDLLVAQGRPVKFSIDRSAPLVNLWHLLRTGKDKKLTSEELKDLLHSAFLKCNKEVLHLAISRGAEPAQFLLDGYRKGPLQLDAIHHAWLFFLRECPLDAAGLAESIYTRALLARSNVPLLRYGLVHGWQPPANTLTEPAFIKGGKAWDTLVILRLLLQFARETIGGPEKERVFREILEKEKRTDFLKVLNEFNE